MPIFTIYLKFKWINYEAEFSSIFIMKHALYIYNDIEHIKQNIIKRGNIFDNYKLEHWAEYVQGRKQVNENVKPHILVFENNNNNLDDICLNIIKSLKEINYYFP